MEFVLVELEKRPWLIDYSWWIPFKNQVSLAKSQGPSQRIGFLGLEICSTTLSFYIPVKKLLVIENNPKGNIFWQVGELKLGICRALFIFFSCDNEDGSFGVNFFSQWFFTNYSNYCFPLHPSSFLQCFIFSKFGLKGLIVWKSATTENIWQPGQKLFITQTEWVHLW